MIWNWPFWGVQPEIVERKNQLWNIPSDWKNHFTKIKTTKKEKCKKHRISSQDLFSVTQIAKKNWFLIFLKKFHFSDFKEKNRMINLVIVNRTL